MGVYLIVLLVLLVGAIVVRHRMLRGPVPAEPLLLDPYLAAHLAGGPDRVALTVLAGMVDDGVLEVDKKGRVGILPGDAITDPMRVAVMRGFGGDYRIRATTLYANACRQPEMRGFGDEALRRGLRYEPAHRRLIMLVPLPVGVLAVAGIGLVFVEVAHGPAVASALPLIIVPGVASFMLMGSTPKATPLGRQALKHATGLAWHSRTDTVVVDGQPYPKSAYAVATKGSMGIRNENLGKALFPPD